MKKCQEVYEFMILNTMKKIKHLRFTVQNYKIASKKTLSFLSN